MKSIKDMTITELKALAYDTALRISHEQRNLQVLEGELQDRIRGEEAVKPAKKEKTNGDK